MKEVIAITPYPIGIKYEEYVPLYVLLKLEKVDKLPKINIENYTHPTKFSGF